MRNYSIRVDLEKRDLDRKILSLGKFISSTRMGALSETAQHLLHRQHMAMIAYSDILEQRLSDMASSALPQSCEGRSSDGLIDAASVVTQIDTLIQALSKIIEGGLNLGILPYDAEDGLGYINNILLMYGVSNDLPTPVVPSLSDPTLENSAVIHNSVSKLTDEIMDGASEVLDLLSSANSEDPHSHVVALTRILRWYSTVILTCWVELTRYGLPVGAGLQTILGEMFYSGTAGMKEMDLNADQILTHAIRSAIEANSTQPE